MTTPPEALVEAARHFAHYESFLGRSEHDEPATEEELAAWAVDLVAALRAQNLIYYADELDALRKELESRPTWDDVRGIVYEMTYDLRENG